MLVRFYFLSGRKIILSVWSCDHLRSWTPFLVRPLKSKHTSDTTFYRGKNRCAYPKIQAKLGRGPPQGWRGGSGRRGNEATQDIRGSEGGRRDGQTGSRRRHHAGLWGVLGWAGFLVPSPRGHTSAHDWSPAPGVTRLHMTGPQPQGLHVST